VVLLLLHPLVVVEVVLLVLLVAMGGVEIVPKVAVAVGFSVREKGLLGFECEILALRSLRRRRR